MIQDEKQWRKSLNDSGDFFPLILEFSSLKVQLEFTALNSQNQIYNLNYKQKSIAVGITDENTYWIIVS